jgi:hypothetical protein
MIQSTLLPDFLLSALSFNSDLWISGDTNSFRSIDVRIYLFLKNSEALGKEAI